MKQVHCGGGFDTGEWDKKYSVLFSFYFEKLTHNKPPFLPLVSFVKFII